MKDQNEPDVEWTAVKPLLSMPLQLRFPCLVPFTSFWLIKLTDFKMRKRRGGKEQKLI